MQKSFLIIAAVYGALSVVLGAFGAHMLKQTVGAGALEVYETGVRYQFYHAFALVAVGILAAWFPGKALVASGWLFTLGVLLFSGSLYLITWMQASGKTVPAGVGVLTPLGGLLLIAGWIFLIVAVAGKKPV